MGKLPEWPEWKRRKDPELWDFYEENILEPGWVGQLAETEYNYILFKILNNYAGFAFNRSNIVATHSLPGIGCLFINLNTINTITNSIKIGKPSKVKME